jgi:PAS domain S-box-containing protein
LRAREVQVRLVLLGSNDGHWRWSAETGELELSSQVYQWLGYEPHEIKPSLAFFQSIVHPEDYGASRRMLLNQLRDLQPFSEQYRLRLKSGNYRLFNVQGQTGRGHNQKPQMSGSITDITDQERAEEVSGRYALQQALTAELGQMALKCEELSLLMSFTISIVNRGLDCEFCRLLSSDTDDRVLLMRGASGWSDEWAGRVRYDAVEETQDRFIIGVRHAIIVDDFLRERRFKPSDMLRAHGVRSGVEMLICGVQDAHGVLGIYSRKAGQFNSDILVFLHGISNILASSMDRFQAQELLTKQELLSRESEERLRKITDSLPAMIAYWDQNGICRFANEAHVRQVGITAAAMLEKSFGEIYGPEFDSARQAQVAVMKGERQRFDMCSQLPSGGKRHWQAEYLPHWSRGEVVGFYALIVDITERKNNEERLVRQEALLAATGRMGEIGGWDQDVDQPVPRLSEMACRIHDLPPGATPDAGSWANFYPPKSLKIVRQSINDAFDLGKPFDYIIPFLTAAGRERWIRSIGEPQLIDGRCVRIVGAIQDVTQQKRLEAELAQSQKLESIGQLAAGIAHEINTPTQFIGNNVEFVSESVVEIFDLAQRIRVMAERGSGPVTAEELLATMQGVDLPYLLAEVPLAIKESQDGIERIKRIVGAMKEFSHPAVEKTLMDINRAIDSTIIVASNEWKYVAEMVTHLDDYLPSVSVMPGSFNQVILNLIVNAAHAISEVADGGGRSKGTITISTRRVDHWAEVSIHDTGCGIPEKIRDRIFDPFFTTKPVGKGTGQGLALAHDVVVNKHGGAIAVESGAAQGTTFILRLPLDPESAQAIAVGA